MHMHCFEREKRGKKSTSNCILVPSSDLMATQLPIVRNSEMVIKELEKICNLTTLLQNEIASICKCSYNPEVGLMFEELQCALRSSLNLLCNTEAIDQNNGIQGSLKRRRADNSQEETENRHVRKEVVTSKPYDDGYIWRKYGRKNILNNMFPRVYYKCAYGNHNNCKAKKYVQRHCKGDPALYKVIYVHIHTCNSNTNTANSSQMLDFSAKETLLPPLSLSSYGTRGGEVEEQEAFLSCLKSVIGGNCIDQPKESDSPDGCDDIISKSSAEPLNSESPPTYHAREMDDMVMMNLFWSQLPEMDNFNYE